MLRFGPADGPVIVAAPALFEEGNRTRAFLVRVLRLLAERGIGSALPDLPGLGESLLPTSDARLAHWRTAFAACALALARPALGFAIRGGALIDAEADLVSRHHLAPASGASLVRDLVRARQASARSEGERFSLADLDGPGPPVLLAGNALDRTLLAELSAAEPPRADRVVRLSSDVAPADVQLEGRPPWRMAEAVVDEPLARALADDLTAWAH